MDVAGYNYMFNRYAADCEAYPNRVIVGSETHPADIDQYWAHVERQPQIIGDFTWTGWDYLGEVGIGRTDYQQGDGDPMAAFKLTADFPWIVAGCGDIDITGHRRPASYYREIVFGLRAAPYIAVQRPEHHDDEIAFFGAVVVERLDLELELAGPRGRPGAGRGVLGQRRGRAARERRVDRASAGRVGEPVQGGVRDGVRAR